jgi:hypothetical protein
MKIITKEVSGIASALYDMRKPMESKGDSVFAFENDRLELIEMGDKDEELLKKLARAKSGSGHNCVMKDIHVHMDITATHDFFLQLYRYHFRDSASSTSKMHCIHKGDITEKCSSFVSPDTIDMINKLIYVYNSYLDTHPDQLVAMSIFLDTILHGTPTKTRKANIPQNKKELFECIIHNTPIGYELTVGETTNYLQLQSIYNQRKNHKMSAWSVDFVNWIKTLPMSYLITGEE